MRAAAAVPHGLASLTLSSECVSQSIAPYIRTLRGNTCHHCRRQGHSLQANLSAQVAERAAEEGDRYRGIGNKVSPAAQFVTLVHRTVLNSLRDVGVFWLRLGMYVGLCVALGTIYFDLGRSWNDAASRGGLIFFTMSFLTFMSISGFPSFVDEMRVRLC